MRIPFRTPQPPDEDPALASVMRQAMQGFGSAAHVPMAGNPDTVQRTRRVVRQQAISSRQRRTRIRTMLFGCLLCAGLMAVLTVPLWNELDEFAHWCGIPDLQMHALFLTVWFLPGTVAGLLLWRQLRSGGE